MTGGRVKNVKGPGTTWVHRCKKSAEMSCSNNNNNIGGVELFFRLLRRFGDWTGVVWRSCSRLDLLSLCVGEIIRVMPSVVGLVLRLRLRLFLLFCMGLGWADRCSCCFVTSLAELKHPSDEVDQQSVSCIEAMLLTLCGVHSGTFILKVKNKTNNKKN